MGQGSALSLRCSSTCTTTFPQSTAARSMLACTPMCMVVAVDDDQDTLDFLRDLLQGAGHTVQTCGRPAEAFTRIREEQPAVVVVDLQMEGDMEAGLRLIAQLRQNPATATIPIILASADHSTLRSQRGALVAQRVTTLDKPFEPQVLLDLVTAAEAAQAGSSSPCPASSPP
jgi:CheY-like chemotaxis protein